MDASPGTLLLSQKACPSTGSWNNTTSGSQHRSPNFDNGNVWKQVSAGFKFLVGAFPKTNSFENNSLETLHGLRVRCWSTPSTARLRQLRSAVYSKGSFLVTELGSWEAERGAVLPRLPLTRRPIVLVLGRRTRNSSGSCQTPTTSTA